ncbi:NTP transferase domain-containing protein [uncultured Serinicoccus sp.]|uniref:NTP transferase domain-containing protein n=1 Tax=uncultured Serinicoccus sp. TaxID=735514 RepID=UPI0026221511|nr:NTP transferase domain-containing protein [uncultured Serinicoccus sp.]
MPGQVVDLLVLAGGRGTRLGGRDKAALEVGGRSLLARVLDAQPLLGGGVVVVGDTPVPAGVLRTVEEPPDGGPVAGIAAGLAALRGGAEGDAGVHGPSGGQAGARSADWVAVVAVDQPGAAVALAALRASVDVAAEHVDAVGHQDAQGYRQWLLAVYRRVSLERALGQLGQVRDLSVRRLVADLRWQDEESGREYLGDVDTWADARDWEHRLQGGPMTTDEPQTKG